MTADQIQQVKPGTRLFTTGCDAEGRDQPTAVRFIGQRGDFWAAKKSGCALRLYPARELHLTEQECRREEA